LSVEERGAELNGSKRWQLDLRKVEAVVEQARQDTSRIGHGMRWTPMLTSPVSWVTRWTRYTGRFAREKAR